MGTLHAAGSCGPVNVPGHTQAPRGHIHSAVCHCVLCALCCVPLCVPQVKLPTLVAMFDTDCDGLLGELDVMRLLRFVQPGLRDRQLDFCMAQVGGVVVAVCVVYTGSWTYSADRQLDYCKAKLGAWSVVYTALAFMLNKALTCLLAPVLPFCEYYLPEYTLQPMFSCAPCVCLP